MTVDHCVGIKLDRLDSSKGCVIPLSYLSMGGGCGTFRENYDWNWNWNIMCGGRDYGIGGWRIGLDLTVVGQDLGGG